MGASLGVALSLLANCGMQDAEGPSPTTGELKKGGTRTSVKPAIGKLFLGFDHTTFCTATLISDRHIITAQRCNPTNSLPSYASFQMDSVAQGYSLKRWYQWGPTDQVEFDGQTAPDHMHYDVAIAELNTPVPSSEATPIFVAAGPPTLGRTITDYGYGSTDRVLSEAPGCCWKNSLTYALSFGGQHIGPDGTDNLGNPTLSPDTGGPATYDGNTANGAIWGVNSWSSGSAGDIWGNTSRFKEDILNVVRMWDGQGVTGLEDGFRRNGQVRSTFTTSSAAACQAQCNADSVCNSFVFTKSSSLCALNRDVGDWVADTNAVSGLSASPRLESSVNRQGFGYANMVVSDASRCSMACSNDDRCAAFTFVSSNSTCYLKEYVGIGSTITGMTSGVKRTLEYYTDRPGSDITDYDLTFPQDMRTCESDCSRHPSCFSFTY